MSTQSKKYKTYNKVIKSVAEYKSCNNGKIRGDACFDKHGLKDSRFKPRTLLTSNDVKVYASNATKKSI